MNLELLEPHPRRVLAAFRPGQFDGLEILGRADEKAFFERCFRERLLESLAAAMPTARKKAEVPPWFILAANLSLRLHGENAFHAWERCYRLVNLVHLRGAARVDVAVAGVPGNRHEGPILYELVEQFVRQVGPGVMKQLSVDRGFLDGPRIAYCQTMLGVDVLIPLKKKMDLWVDAWRLAEPGPWLPQVEPAAAPAPPVARPPGLARREQHRQRTLAQRRAHAPAPDPATLLTRRELCPLKGFHWGQLPVPLHVVVLRATYADGHQEGWALMTTADFRDPQQPPRDYALRSGVEEGHRQFKCFYDLTEFHSRCFNAVVAQGVFVVLRYTLRQWQLWQSAHEELLPRHPKEMQRGLDRHDQYGVIYPQHAYAQLPLVSFAREVLELAPAARRKALTQMRRLEKSFLTPWQNLPPP